MVRILRGSSNAEIPDAITWTCISDFLGWPNHWRSKCCPDLRLHPGAQNQRPHRPHEGVDQWPSRRVWPGRGWYELPGWNEAKIKKSMESGKKNQQKKKQHIGFRRFYQCYRLFVNQQAVPCFLIKYSFPFFFLPPYLNNIFYIWGFSITESSGQEVVT